MSEPTYTFEGLRGVGRVELSFVPDQRVYALFGTNGVGKTKCLEALFQYHVLRHEEFQWADGEPRLIPQDLVAQSITSKFGGKLVLTEDWDKGRKTLDIEDDASERTSLPCVFLGAGERGHILLDTVQLGVPVGTFEQRRQRYFELLLEGMRKHFSSLGMHANLEQWFVTLAQSANPYQTANDNRRVEIDTLLRLLNKIDVRFSPDFMQVDGANRVSLKVDGVVTQLLHLSTGFTSLVKLLQPIISGYANFTNEPDITQVKGLVFIDEIENHLHVSWQTNLISLLQGLFPNTTFYVTTHSPLVLSQLKQGEAYILKRDFSAGFVRSELIKNPSGKLMVDMLNDVFKVDMNALKRDRFDPAAQAEAKKLLLELLGDAED
jgi:AAA domain, putative AbiEii toxin, Type IV TA system